MARDMQTDGVGAAQPGGSSSPLVGGSVSVPRHHLSHLVRGVRSGRTITAMATDLNLPEATIEALARSPLVLALARGEQVAG